MAPRKDRLCLRLFVAGASPDSAVAIANLRSLFPDPSRVDIEVVDVQQEPARAVRDGIIVTPTLLKLAPAPGCRILGNLRNRQALLHLLGIAAPEA